MARPAAPSSPASPSSPSNIRAPLQPVHQCTDGGQFSIQLLGHIPVIAVHRDPVLAVGSQMLAAAHGLRRTAETAHADVEIPPEKALITQPDDIVDGEPRIVECHKHVGLHALVRRHAPPSLNESLKLASAG